MTEEECVSCIFGATVGPRYALLFPTLLPIVIEVLKTPEPSLQQLRLSVRALEPRTSYLAGWGFTMCDRAITCEEIGKNKIIDSTEKREKSPNWGSGAVWYESRFWIAAICYEDKVSANSGKIGTHVENQHVTGRRSKCLVRMQQYNKNKGYLL